jgi:hypothetical protein
VFYRSRPFTSDPCEDQFAILKSQRNSRKVFSLESKLACNFERLLHLGLHWELVVHVEYWFKRSIFVRNSQAGRRTS